MTHVYFDASALAKSYLPEPGTPEVNYIFARVPPGRFVVLSVGLGEVASVFVRKRNAGSITAALATQALNNFRAQVVDDPAVIKVEVILSTVTMSLSFIDRHSINGTDALVLLTALEFEAGLRASGHDLILVTSDRRLGAAARAEGLTVYDPERQPAADFDAAFTL